jgi:hypothetical protein
MNPSRVIALVLLLFGVCLHTYTEAVKSTSFSMGFWLLSLSPYVVSALLLFAFRKPQMAAGAIGLPAIFDAGAYYSAFIDPQSSTASLGLLFVPIWNLLLFAPIGAAVGFLVGRRAVASTDMLPNNSLERTRGE